MRSPRCQAFIVPSAALDYLYDPVNLGWSVWDDHALDGAFQPFRDSPELESVWLSCFE